MPRDAKKAAKPKRLRFKMEDIEIEGYFGYCTECGCEHDSCEPDTRYRKCDECGKPAVFGAEELFIMGLVD